MTIIDTNTGTLADPLDYRARGTLHDDTTFTAVTPLIERALPKPPTTASWNLISSND